MDILSLKHVGDDVLRTGIGIEFHSLGAVYEYNTIHLFYCFILFHMSRLQNTFINMFNISTKNDMSFSIMLNNLREVSE